MIGIASIFKRLEQKSNRYDRYLAFSFLFVIFFVLFGWIFFLSLQNLNIMFSLWNIELFPLPLFLFGEKGLEFDLASVCVRLVTKYPMELLVFFFSTYINSHSCNSRRNPFITSRWPDKNSFQKYFRFLSFFFYSRRLQCWLFSIFFFWFSCEPFAELFPKSASPSIFFLFVCVTSIK